MKPTHPSPVPQERRPSQSDFTIRFFAVCVVVFTVGGGLAVGLIRLLSPAVSKGTVRLPGAFLFSSLLLAIISMSLQAAVQHVRIERQHPFRRSLLAALAAGTVFLGVQSQGLWQLMQSQDLGEVATSVGGFTLGFAALHALHVTVALLFLVFVVVRAFADHYDHEYYWGVTVTAGLWHLLGCAWLAILAVFLIAT
jgi:heme/copper-type cytochrome/quinol oxidase subunit 3